MIAGGGFSLMAWELVKRRRGCQWMHPEIMPSPREFSTHGFSKPTADFYAMLDRAWYAFYDGHQTVDRIVL